MPLVREEQETVVTLCRGEEFGTFSTTNPTHAKAMERRGLKPERLSFMDKEPISWVFKIPADWFKLPSPKKQVSEETRELRRESMKQRQATSERMKRRKEGA